MVTGIGRYSLMPQSEIVEGSYRLRAIEREHIETIRQWRNAQIEILRQSQPISIKEQETYFEDFIWPDKTSDAPNNILLVLIENNVLIGYGGLVHISWDYKHAEVSFLLEPEKAKSDKIVVKLFSLWLRLMKNLAFCDLGLQRLTTETYASRSLYIQILEENGFRREGQLRNHVVVNGEYVDSLIHGCLAKEFAVDLGIASENVNNVLISSASCKIPLIRAMQLAVGKINHTSKVIAGDTDSSAPARQIVDEFWLMPQLTEVPLNKLIEICEARGINRILPTRDGELEFWAKAKPILAENGIGVIVSSFQSISRCLDKLTFSKWGGENYPVIPASTMPTFFGNINLVVKERFGSGAKNIGLNLSQESALAHAQSLNHPIFQPFVEGPEISVDAYVSNEGRVHGLVTRYRNRVVSGESQVTTTFRHESLENSARDIIEALDLFGPVVMQAIVTSAGLEVIEVNPRVGGASTASISVGLDMLSWALLESGNNAIELPEFVRSSDDVRQIRIPQDMVVHDSGF